MHIDFKRLNHIQICIPKDKEAEARRFYCDLLGLEEIEKPEYLQKNGGFWLKIADIELHIGTEESVHPSKRHPAFEIRKIEAIKAQFIQKGIRLKEDRSLPAFHRFSFYDPFQNRIELLEEKTPEEIEYLGKEVYVQVDRPIKSKHPRSERVYELNYGYIPYTTGGDGEEVDAYIIGEESPIEDFRGIVQAVIVRYNDRENKLVVAQSTYELSKEEIERRTEFQEKYFDTIIRMRE